MDTAKLLYRRLDSLFGTLDARLPQRKVLESFLEESYNTLREDLRLAAGLLYGERRDSFELTRVVGETEGRVAESLDPTQPPLSLVFRHRVYIFDPAAEESPQRLGLFPRRGAAALVVGRRPNRHVLFFLLSEGWPREELDFALNTVRAALGSRLTDARVRGSFREAAEIQQSLLLEEPPDFPGYEIACRSVPAEEVGGDFYDFFPFDGEMLGIAVGDASGHGLPAALLVRDLVTGLRMGIEKDLKMSHVFSKLNRVIHRSNLSSRFVSVFYGELEADGTLIYINAGHQPPMLFVDDPKHPDRIIELVKGGTVIGPLPEARFQRGIAHVRRGEILVLCTDGILERRNRAGDFFGEERLKEVVRKGRHGGTETILESIFAAAFEFGGERPWEDDATVVVVRRLAEPPPAGR
jgi:sigma-B regulation protein RsbU (phosphoserine phosphatase)